MFSSLYSWSLLLMSVVCQLSVFRFTTRTSRDLLAWLWREQLTGGWTSPALRCGGVGAGNELELPAARHE